MRTAREVLVKLAEGAAEMAEAAEQGQGQADPEELSRRQKVHLGMAAGAAPWVASEIGATIPLVASRRARIWDALIRGGEPTLNGALNRAGRGLGVALGLGSLLGGGLGLAGAQPETAGGVAGVLPGALLGAGLGTRIGGVPGALAGLGLGGFGGYQAGAGMGEFLRNRSA